MNSKKDRNKIHSMRSFFRFLILPLSLFIVFRWAPHLWLLDKLFGSNSKLWWENFQLDSDGLVLARLQETISNGIFSYYGALGVDGSYNSQFGLASWLNTVIVSAVPTELSFKLSLLYTICAVGNAILLSTFLSYVRKAFGVLPFLAALLILIQPWPTAMLHSIYWSIWIKFLPALAFALSMKLNLSKVKTLVIVFISSLITFLSGYEFVTVTFFSALSLIFFIQDFDTRPLRSKVKSFSEVALTVISAFVLALMIHLLQIRLILKGTDSAIEYLSSTIYKRTGVSSNSVDSIYLESLGSSPLSVLDRYLGVPVFGAPEVFPLISLFTMTFLFTLTLICANLAVAISDSVQKELTVLKFTQSWLVGLLGPIGWILLARPHSFIHTHINFALWYLFSAPLAAAILLKSYSQLCNRSRSMNALRNFVIGFLIVVLIFFIYSQFSVLS
jgi:hypothetical protein